MGTVHPYSSRLVALVRGCYIRSVLPRQLTTVTTIHNGYIHYINLVLDKAIACLYSLVTSQTKQK